MKRLVTIMRGLTVLAALLAAPVAGAAGQVTPAASPQASPVAIARGCNDLPAYFRALAELTLENEGLVIMRGAGFDALALSDEEAAAVVDSLDGLIPELEALTPPAPATAYHAAYLEMMGWYQALAANRDAASYQRLINDDRRLFGLMGLAIQSGQAACGYEAWNEAVNAAFPPEG